MKANNSNSRGSEWRIWDIHAHTPASHGYSGTFTEFITNAQNSPAKVIGVNDYCTLEGYQEIMKLGGVPGKVLFPVIEFRMNNIVANRQNPDPTKSGVKINFHVIFDNDESLFHKILTWRNSLHCIDETGHTINLGTAADLRKLTFDFKTVIDSLDDINLLNHHALIWLPYDEYGGIDQIDPTDNFFKLHLIQKAHIMGSGSINQVEFFKWKDPKYPAEICQKWFDAPKPCIKGSDAHKATYPLGHLMDKDSKPIDRFCWINAEPTFDGLKQIINEPDRVYIGDKPELLKRVEVNPTKFIRSLEISRLLSPPFDDIWFDDIKIEFNSALVAIIGNKGNGKSAITDIVSLCGNTHQNPDDFSFLTKQKFRNPKPKNFSEYYTASLKWHYGDPNTKLLSENPDKTNPERVKYIPQKLLENLCSDIESDDFRHEIEKIIYSHVPEDDRLGLNSLDELIDHRTAQILPQISKKLNALSLVNKEIENLEKLSSPSYLQSLSNELNLKKNQLKANESTKPPNPIAVARTETDEKLSAEIVSLRLNIDGLTLKIEGLKMEKTTKTKTLDDLNQTKEWYQALGVELGSYTESHNRFVQILESNQIKPSEIFKYKINVHPIEVATKALEERLAEIIRELDNKVANTTAFVLEGLRQQLLILQEKLDKPAKELQQYLSRLEEWEARKKLIIGNESTEGTIKYLESRLKYLEGVLPTDIAARNEQRLELVKEIFRLRSRLKDVRKELYKPITKLVEENDELCETYPLRMDVSFDVRSLIRDFFLYISKAKVGTFYGDTNAIQRLQTIVENIDFESETGVISFLSEIDEAVTSDLRTDEVNQTQLTDQLKQNVTPSQFYDFLYGLNYLEPSYSLKLADKGLSQLSPGERGALLLIFYLSLDFNDIPLIIDQPEDNLDNESIFRDLITLIKKAKTRRQVIMVTHNPNLALGCDAEQIIRVKIDKENKNKVSFESGGIEDYSINKISVDILEGTILAFDSRGAKWTRKRIQN